MTKALSNISKSYYQQQSWRQFLDGLGKTRRIIIIAIAKDMCGTKDIAKRTLLAPNTISVELAFFTKAKILERVKPGIFRIRNFDLAQYCADLDLIQEMELTRDRIIEIANERLYNLALDIFTPLSLSYDFQFRPQTLAYRAQSKMREALDNYLGELGIDDKD